MPTIGLMADAVAKRTKQNQQQATTKHSCSGIYRAFRSIGHVTNNVPFDIQIKGTQFLITTCIGRSFQTYDCAKLNLLFVSSQLQHTIKVVVSQSDLLLVASGPYVVAFKRGKELWRLGAESDDHISQLLTFGSYICAVNSQQQLLVYNSTSQELHTTISLRIDVEVTCLLHSATYLNKIVVASSDGSLELWNIRTGDMVHRTEAFGQAVTAMASSPVIDVIAIGLIDGTIIVYHLRAAEKMITLRQQGRVNSISFRTDGIQIMATANDHGEVAFWDLDKRKVSQVLRTAHAGSISTIHFLSGQPILVSAGSDNAIREWIFDSLDGTARLLRSRTGHHEPPTTIDFYGENSHFILSASRDQALIGFSVYRDAQTQELSQGSVQSLANKTQSKVSDLKLAEIVAIASQNAREKDWDNVLTAHKDDSAARTWHWLDRRLGKHTLPTSDKSAVRSVAISACGNFGLVGSNRGLVDCYNMQSGLHRRTYKSDNGHTKAVTGIASDSVNKVMLSASLDGTLKLWDFHKGTLLDTINLGVGITSIKFQAASDLVAVSCDDFVVRIIDVETKKVVREFWGHTNRITAIDFSNDGRWLVSASLDGTIRTFDLPTGHTIDAIRTPTVCTALSFSPSGEYLATAHIDSVGIHLWTNKSQFVQVSTRNISEEQIDLVEMPNAAGQGGAGLVEVALDSAEQPEEIDELDSHQTMNQLSSELLTMSMVPRSKWQNLLDLDTIRQRNKPKEPPKAPEKLPFDLGTLRDLRTGSGLASEKQEQDPSTSRHLVNAGLDSDSEFTKLIQQRSMELVEHMAQLGPAQVDISIRSLSPVDNFLEFISFIEALTHRLEQRRDYELCQVYFATFLRCHGDLIAENISTEEGLERALLRWRYVQETERARLCDLVGYCNGVLKFLTEK